MTTFQTCGPIAAVIELGCGDVKISASDRTDCVVVIAPRDAAKQVDVQAAGSALVEFTNGILEVRTVKPWRRFIGPTKNDGSVVVSVELPSGSSLTATTSMGLVHCEGELTDADIKTGMGDIRADRVGALSAKTGFGSIAVESITKDATVKTGSGSIRLGVIDGSAIVKNSNGTVEVAQSGRDTHIRTANGNIVVGRALGSLSAGSAAGAIRIAEVSAGSVVVRTGIGAIEIGIRDGVAAWLDVNSKYGSVRNALTVATGPAESESTVEVRARTGAGDITIDRASAA